MAMIGLPKSPSFMPVARQRPRAPAMLRPWVEVRERYGGMGRAYGLGKGAQQRQLTVIFAFFLSPQQGRAYGARERDPRARRRRRRRGCSAADVSALPREQRQKRRPPHFDLPRPLGTFSTKRRNGRMGGSIAGLERASRDEGVGEIQFDAFARGRYATDASSYQIMPLGVVIPGSIEEAARALRVARSRGVPVLPRGGGTSQSGQTVNAALVVDCSKRLTKILSLDTQARRCKVEPGIVLDELNRRLKPEGLWFPVDISTASRATIGGMAGNNSCGGRSLRYGTMRYNVLSIDAVLADGSPAHFGAVQADLSDLAPDDPRRTLFQDILRIGVREADEVAARFPAVQRRVGGYNLDALTPPGSQSDGNVNLAHLLVGSEGTLAFSTAIELKLSPLLGRRAVGVCHFGSFFEAMDAAQHIVALKPIAVELVESDDENRKRLSSLTQLLGDLGFGWDRPGRKWGGVVEVLDPALQTSIAEMRAGGLNIMMSMKDARKPVSFVEDCAVPLPHLAEYTARLTEVFEKHGTRGTWYAHASEGCLHVRPVLNLKLDKDVKAMRAIAEEAFALVRAYKGSHSGEHGDGIVRSEFHESMFGSRLVRAFE